VSQTVVLDTSAIFAFLDNEPGADEVRGHLDGAACQEVTVWVSFVTLTELRYILIQEKGEDAAEQALALVRAWPINVHHSDESICRTAASLKAHHRISLADAFVAATADQHEARLVHKDQEFEAVGGLVELAPLPYKR